MELSLIRLISKLGFSEALLTVLSEDTIAAPYNGTALKTLVSKVGVSGALVFLGDPNLPQPMRESLAQENFIIGGYPNVELILTLE